MRLLARRDAVASGPLQRFGDAAGFVPTRGAGRASGLAAAIRAERIPGVTDVVGGASSVLVRYEPTGLDFASLSEQVASVRATTAKTVGKRVILDVCFDGEDLEEVGERSGLGPSGVRRALLGATLRASFLGFAPGFAYLSGLPRPLRSLPRRPAPRSAVPAGSLAVGGGHAAFYPRSTPGGWHIVGRTDAVLFDPEHAPHALLEPGDTVRLREVGPSELARPTIPSRSARRHRACVFVAESAGLYSTFQDEGRAGLAHLGVPRSGAVDAASYAMANALVGNPPGAACLEIAALGPTLRCTADTYVAVVGAGTEVTLDGHPVGCGRVVPVTAGQRLAIGPTGSNLRAYLAVRGGFDVPAVLGSRATDRLAGLGPDPLGPGDELGVLQPAGPMADHLLPGAPGLAAPAHPRRVRATTGPGEGRRWRELFESPLLVEEPSDRIGVRLRPREGPLGGSEGELPSAGTTVGTIQVPPSGQPVALLADHATLGGYPVGAVVITADVAELARLRPGETVELVEVDQDEALDALRALNRAVRESAVGAYPLRAG